MGTEKQKTIWKRNKHPMEGRHHSEESLKKMSKTKTGVPNFKLRETCKKLGLNKGSKNPNFGKKTSEETKQKIREAVSGEKSVHWIDGRSYNASPARYGENWANIRYLVYRRDKFTCQDCRVKGKSLDVHHKVPFLNSKDNSFNNLISLCRNCHMKEERIILNRIMKGGSMIYE